MGRRRLPAPEGRLREGREIPQIRDAVVRSTPTDFGCIELADELVDAQQRSLHGIEKQLLPALVDGVEARLVVEIENPLEERLSFLADDEEIAARFFRERVSVFHRCFNRVAVPPQDEESLARFEERILKRKFVDVMERDFLLARDELADDGGEQEESQDAFQCRKCAGKTERGDIAVTERGRRNDAEIHRIAEPVPQAFGTERIHAVDAAVHGTQFEVRRRESQDHEDPCEKKRTRGKFENALEKLERGGVRLALAHCSAIIPQPSRARR